MSIGGVHNLTFIPKNQDFNTFEGRPYKNPMVIHYCFMQLGYGKQMADALRERAAEMLRFSETVTLQGTLNSLIQTWNDVSDRSMIPLTLLKGIRASRPKASKKGDSFLVLHNGKLYIARSGMNIDKSLTIGFNSGFAQASALINMTDQEIRRKSMVTSMFDAVAHLYGGQPKLSKGGPNWYTPIRTSHVMSEITGALTLLSVILTGKMKPYGKFMSAVPKPKCPIEYMNADLQPVCFDLPIPYGLAYSTFAKEVEPESRIGTVPVRDFCTVGVERWDPFLNYSYPVVVGGPREDDAKCVREAVFSVTLPLLPDDETNMRVQEDHHPMSMTPRGSAAPLDGILNGIFSFRT